MSKRNLNLKMTVLTEIRESKDILFGPFSAGAVTKELKVKEWNKICDLCKSLQLITPDKDYAYVRDVFWSNIKRATLAKLESLNQTGSKGGRTKIITPLDEIVLDILGKTTCEVDDFNINIEDKIISIPDIDGDISNFDVTPRSQNLNYNCNGNKTAANGFEAPKTFLSSNFPNRKVIKVVTKKFKSNRELEKTLSLKRKKMELEVEFLSLQNYKKKLEIFDMEQRLNISHSDFTRDIESRQQFGEDTESNETIEDYNHSSEFNVVDIKDEP